MQDGYVTVPTPEFALSAWAARRLRRYVAGWREDENWPTIQCDLAHELRDILYTLHLSDEAIADILGERSVEYLDDWDRDAWSVVRAADGE